MLDASNIRIGRRNGETDVGMGIAAVVDHVAQQITGLPEDRQALVRQDFGRAFVASLGIRYTGYRQLSALSKGQLPGPEASAGKLAGTHTARAVADLAVRLIGDEAVYARTSDGTSTWQDSQAGLPGMAIAGGTDEILRNILGERVLGLPPEPRADKGITFTQSLASAGTSTSGGVQ